jgi:nicotinamidase/pyrazinamidase
VDKEVVEEILIYKDTALMITDIQYDFCPGGALPIEDGDKIVPIFNKYIEKVKREKGYIIATRDWHPADHISFKERGGIWPIHCVQGTEGAQFLKDLRLPEDVMIISKATKRSEEAYSAFKGTELDNFLKEKRIRKLLIGGLATDYCVKNSIIDALSLGYEVYFLEDASKGVDLEKGDVEKAINEIVEKGARRIKFEDLE